MMSPVRASVFLIGATGYVGGGVLGRLLVNAKPLFDITVLLRNAVKADKLKPFGVKTVIGTLDDTAKITELASQADIVIECADADHMASTQAVLAGIKKRYTETGKPPSLIHTSGTGVFADDAAGMRETDTIYYDTNVEQLAQIPPEQPHRKVDSLVLAADEEGYVKSYLVLPSMVYGLAKGPLVDAGIMNPQSQQIPALILAGMDRNRAGMVGEGKNIKPNVHIDDTVHLYEVLWDAIETCQDIGHGKEGYYFAENGEHRLHDVAKQIGKVLKDFGLADTEEPSSFTQEELDKYFAGSDSLGSNSRCRAERSRAIGWKPSKTTDDMLASIKPEIQYMLSRVSPYNFLGAESA
ncbi:NAD-P-binding protein [Trametes coccinea BRFM310]|uniref:NAD-P-binding protein n=1 Tax=Trametes coccinea (strain BRFM310) TaxID=1353009 RepID=A0A1Y2IV83_TRAC3|nr:NAD-P-binding protein [Trametes coccinea BRFM310]